MMKKLALLSTLAITINATSSYAGTMGAELSESHYIIKPFVSAEGAYSWYSNSNHTMATGSSIAAISTSHDGWGGRAAFGTNFVKDSPLSFGTEIGWGYYAKSSLSSANLNNTSYYYGFDALAGLNYTVNKLELFAKAGAMLMNRTMNASYANTSSVGGISLSNTVHDKFITNTTMPEIKVGGIYNFNPNLGLSLAYMHLFGVTPQWNTQNSATSTSVTNYRSTNLGLASFDTIMFGLRYQWS